MEAQTETRVKLHIFVNGIKFEDARVKSQMTGAEIAALAEIPADQAVVRRETGPQQGEEIPADKEIKIHQADHFTVTRKQVQGGAC
jgi:hypothetical protein